MWAGRAAAACQARNGQWLLAPQRGLPTSTALAGSIYGKSASLTEGHGGTGQTPSTKHPPHGSHETSPYPISAPPHLYPTNPTPPALPCPTLQLEPTLNLSSSTYLGSCPWLERLRKKASSSSPASASAGAAAPLFFWRLPPFLPAAAATAKSAAASAYASCNRGGEYTRQAGRAAQK